MPRPFGCCALGLLLIAGCAVEQNRPADSGVTDRRLPVEGFTSSENALEIIDFVVQGCAQHTADRCTGTPPLTLVFAAVLQGEPKSLSWDFGDHSASQSGRVVSHTYGKPGSFTVTLGAVTVSGPVVEQKQGFVRVDAAGPGEPCSDDTDCASGSCVCRDSCPFPLSDGLCLQSCQQNACYLSDTACVDLSFVDPEDAPPWRTWLCLPTCSVDADCRAGFLCRLSPGTSGWIKACLPPFPREIGQPCRGVDGAVDHAQCLGGLCLDVGVAGACSASCEGGTGCPEGARCARLASQIAAVCLLRCVDESSCASDPGLACELPNSAGELGFEILGPLDPPGTRYCAPKRCLLDSDCGPLARCDLDQGGFCLRR